MNVIYMMMMMIIVIMMTKTYHANSWILGWTDSTQCTTLYQTFCSLRQRKTLQVTWKLNSLFFCLVMRRCGHHQRYCFSGSCVVGQGCHVNPFTFQIPAQWVFSKNTKTHVICSLWCYIVLYYIILSIIIIIT